MRDVLLLTKVLLKGSKAQTESKSNKIKKFILIFVALAYLMGVVGFGSREIVSALVIFKMEFYFIKLALIGMFSFYIMQTIVAGLNVLFFSKDIETLLPLPIKPYKIVMAKMNTLIISEYLIGTIVLAPALLVYGYILKLGVTYYIFAVLAFLLLPIVPVIIISLLVSLIMKITNIFRNKNLVQYLSILLTLVLVFAIEAMTATMGEYVTGEEIANLTTSLEKVATEYSILYMPVKPLYEMVINHNNIDGIKNLGIALIASMAVYLIGANIISKIYLKVVTSLVSNSKKKKGSVKTSEYKVKSIKSAFLKKDMSLLLRNPNFFLQCLLTPFLMVILLGASTIISVKDIPQAELEFIRGYINEGYPFAILLAIIGLSYAFNFISATAYSRDGASARALKYIPVDFEDQIAYKTLAGTTVNFILMCIILVAIKIVVNTLSYSNIIMLVLLGTIINVVNNYIGVLIDLKNPKLNWISEQTVVKQNFNTMILMGILSLQLIGIVYLGYKLQNLDNFIIIVALIYAFCFRLIKSYIKKNKLKLYEKIN